MREYICMYKMLNVRASSILQNLERTVSGEFPEAKESPAGRVITD